MPEADKAYLSTNQPAMTRRTLLAALIAALLPKPQLVEPPMPPTCIGMRPYVGELAPFPATCIDMPPWLAHIKHCARTQEH
jgi:hypothetical protein